MGLVAFSSPQWRGEGKTAGFGRGEVSLTSVGKAAMQDTYNEDKIEDRVIACLKITPSLRI
jgi:hypothetical protein